MHRHDIDSHERAVVTPGKGERAAPYHLHRVSGCSNGMHANEADHHSSNILCIKALVITPTDLLDETHLGESFRLLNPSRHCRRRLLTDFNRSNMLAKCLQQSYFLASGCEVISLALSDNRLHISRSSSATSKYSMKYAIRGYLAPLYGSLRCEWKAIGAAPLVNDNVA